MIRVKNTFVIIHKSGKLLISAESKDDAFIKFFEMLYDGKLGLEDVGHVIILFDGKESYPLRTVPALWLLGLLDTQSAIANLKSIMKGKREGEILDLLLETAKEDAWIVKGVWKIE